MERYSMLAKRDELAAREEASVLVPPASEPEGDLVDCASADAEAELQVRLHETDGRLLKAIEDALMRIRTGAFGVCEACKHPISKARLEAVPWTRLCRECKEREQFSRFALVACPTAIASNSSVGAAAASV